MGIQHDVGEYLVSQRPPKALSSLAEGAVVFVETRDAYFGPLAMQAAMRAHPGWTPYVLGTPDVLRRFGDDFHRVEIQHLRGPSDFSRLLFSKAFWKLFPEPRVLLVQTDTVVVRGCRQDHARFDCIGAVCGNLGLDTFVINGGLSLRKPAAMLRALDLMTPEDLDLPEDVAFTRVMRRHPHAFALPTMEHCHDFAIESLGNPAKAIGAHGTDKYYCPPDVLRALVN